MSIEEMVEAGYSIIAIAPDRDPKKDRDVTGEVEELFETICALGDMIGGRTRTDEEVRGCQGH